ncbi:hypothetical protein [Pseudomonas sp. JG-B]|uniref:hypothetical protein n=1 Tax=Pseudomonas sp. JG-B TaxID=2603214 RepID=UPI00129D714F|nr:hypothetical protein [Pseudomonas sp. JG-B]MRK19067.1 hypothetical protein [Pseudomonas sp. JG-B]
MKEAANAPAEPRSMREALAVVALEEIDGLIIKLEAVAGKVTASDEQFAATMQALDEAAERFRAAVSSFTETGKA